METGAENTIEQRGNSEKIIELPNRSCASPKEIIREMKRIDQRMEYYENRIKLYKDQKSEREDSSGCRHYFVVEVPAEIIGKIDDIILDYYMGEVAYGEACLDSCIARLKEAQSP